MTKISIAELEVNAGRYVEMAQDTDVLIIKNGKLVAKLVTAKPDKVAAAKALFGAIPNGADIDLDKVQEERLGL
jgi:antitoxin (DNA-binding transcriptional repressor) of toxin-antitoxin stability system